MPIAVKNVGDDKVLISQSYVSKNKVHEKLYLTDKDKADKFVKQLKHLDNNDGAMKLMSIAASGVVGYLVASSLSKVGLAGKIAAGVVSAVSSLLLLIKADNWLDKSFREMSLKTFGAQDVTGQNFEDQNESKADLESDIKQD